MKKTHRSHARRLAILAVTLLAATATAQVPQDMTYTGRLVDNLGDPLAGPVDLELRVFDAATGPSQLYGEEHLSVVLDATGGFSVQLGLGTGPQPYSLGNPRRTQNATLGSHPSDHRPAAGSAEVTYPWAGGLSGELRTRMSWDHFTFAAGTTRPR